LVKHHQAKVYQQAEFFGSVKGMLGKQKIQIMMPIELIKLMSIEHGTELAYHINQNKELVLSKCKRKMVMNKHQLIQQLNMKSSNSKVPEVIKQLMYIPEHILSQSGAPYSLLYSKKHMEILESKKLLQEDLME
jgi:hypothetical protein